MFWLKWWFFMYLTNVFPWGSCWHLKVSRSGDARIGFVGKIQFTTSFTKYEVCLIIFLNTCFPSVDKSRFMVKETYKHACFYSKTCNKEVIIGILLKNVSLVEIYFIQRRIHKLFKSSFSLRVPKDPQPWNWNNKLLSRKTSVTKMTSLVALFISYFNWYIESTR